MGVVVPAEAVVNPVNPQPSAPMLVGADADTSYVAVAVSEDEILLPNSQRDFTLDPNAIVSFRQDAHDSHVTVTETNQVRRNYLDADEEAVIVSGNSSLAEARATNNNVHTANRVRPEEVLEYDPNQQSKVGATKFDYVDDSEYKTKYTVDKKPIGEGYKFSSDNYETAEYKFGDEY